MVPTKRPTWVTRLADIPGVAYAGMDEAHRRQLPAHDAAPTVYRFGDSESLSWGESSWSPAHQHQLQEEDVSTARVLQNLAETLDLPGTAEDYHFAIQAATSQLFSRRLEEPHVLDEVERLCLLNIALVEAQPDAVALGLNGDIAQGFVEMSCFPTLIALYEEEGALPEATRIAERAVAFGKCADALERLAQKEAALIAEDEP